MIRLVILVLAATACVADGVEPPPSVEAQVVRRAPLRGGGKTIGEVRLVRRGDATVVETVLRTLLLRRVVGKIRDKELANWPPERPGHDDALAYIKALEELQSELARRAKLRSNRLDRSQKLLIEFSSSPSSVAVTLQDIDVEADGDVFRVTRRGPPRGIRAGRNYVDRNMRLIIADSFGISEAEAAGWLAVRPTAGRSNEDATQTESPHE